MQLYVQLEVVDNVVEFLFYSYHTEPTRNTIYLDCLLGVALCCSRKR